MTPEPPRSCPRCASTRASKRLGTDWCCWELVALEALMTGEKPATMRELTGVYFIGRSEKSIDAACRRYGFKIPVREKATRRARCRVCNRLYAKNGQRCCNGCVANATDAAHARAA